MSTTHIAHDLHRHEEDQNQALVLCYNSKHNRELRLSSSGYMPSLPLCGTSTINNAFLEKEIQGGFHKQFRTSPLKKPLKYFLNG